MSFHGLLPVKEGCRDDSAVNEVLGEHLSHRLSKVQKRLASALQALIMTLALHPPAHSSLNQTRWDACLQPAYLQASVLVRKAVGDRLQWQEDPGKQLQDVHLPQCQKALPEAAEVGRPGRRLQDAWLAPRARRPSQKWWQQQTALLWQAALLLPVALEPRSSCSNKCFTRQTEGWHISTGLQDYPFPQCVVPPRPFCSPLVQE